MAVNLKGPLSALQVMQDAPVIPVIVLHDVAHAVPMARALVAGGIRMLEVTLRTPQARCADGHGTLTHLFFSDDVLDIARAKAICSKCKLTASCLDGALDRAEPWGVWGGELIENGRIVVHKRPRGRPPKHPRPLVVVDECPIPPHLVA